MTPEQHEKQAERVLDQAAEFIHGSIHDGLVARAQAHVLLALSMRAGKAMSTEYRYPGGGPR